MTTSGHCEGEATFEQRDVATGVGLALRWAFIDEVTDATRVAFFEISPENYMRRGGYFPDALSAIVAHHAVSTHGLALNIGSSDPLDLEYLARLRRFLDELGVHSHSDHLCWNGTDGQNLHDLLPLAADAGTVRHVAERIERVQDRLARPLVLENISYYLLPTQTMPEHAFVASVLDAADCRLLLDVNNVWVNAHNHGFDPYDYLREMPLERVDRIHVAGGERLARYDGLVIDTHGVDVPEEVAQMMAWVVERVGPVPVVYERDHAIPALSDLEGQVAQLQRVYDEALERRRCRTSPGGTSPIVVHSSSVDRTAVHGVQTGLSRAVLDAAAPEDGLAERLTARGLGVDVVELVASLGAPRLGVYRDLVRNTLRRTIRSAMPRSAARRGKQEFSDDMSRWLDEHGPRSRYLYDVALEAGEWLAVRWRGDPAAPAYLPDLLCHELLDWEVRARPSNHDSTAPPFRWSLDARLVFDGSVRLARYDWRVHELADDPDRTAAPAPGDTWLLAYRDAEHDVRYLELSPLAYEAVSRLMRGQRLEEALVEGAEASAQALDDHVLSRLGTLLFDLAERHVLRGASA